MAASWEWKHPQSWSAAGFTLDPFDLVFLPGGQDKHTRQLIDSFVVHQLLADYFPMTRRPSKKAIGAVCYGVKVLADTKRGDGKSVLHGCYTTTLPQAYENIAYWSTRLFMGDYMRVYGAGSSHVESWVSPCPNVNCDLAYVLRLGSRSSSKARRPEEQLAAKPVSQQSYSCLFARRNKKRSSNSRKAY